MATIRRAGARRSPLLLSLLLSGAPAAPGPAWSATPAEAPAGETGLVVKVIDGDTLDVMIGGKRQRVRLIGIDAPEKRTEELPAEPFEKEATAFARRMAGGQQVVLTTDPAREDRDRYGRLLRYVHLPDGRLLNLDLVCQGYARAYTRYRFARQKEFRACEKEARERGLGQWAPR